MVYQERIDPKAHCAPRPAVLAADQLDNPTWERAAAQWHKRAPSQGPGRY